MLLAAFSKTAIFWSPANTLLYLPFVVMHDRDTLVLVKNPEHIFLLEIHISVYQIQYVATGPLR